MSVRRRRRITYQVGMGECKKTSDGARRREVKKERIQVLLK